jgi:methylthioribose-1-phosphate isomerase
MSQGKIDAVIVGADRITANGDFANKIGTYSLAIAAKAHSVPFYVAAPLSSFDISLKTGKEIPIEERRPDEITCAFGCRTAPPDINVYNPAFDVTPNNYVTAFITEKQAIYPPFEESISQVTAGGLLI